MLTVDYGDGQRVQVAPGTSVLEASIARGIHHAHACDGRGLCTTCRVRVESGYESCPPASELESQALAMNGLEPPVRLACQLRPTGDVRVRILITEHQSPARAVPDATEELVAALFTDIRGFTAFAESHLPFDVASVLNRYFDTVGVVVERNDGHILDYLGDGIMILFRPGGDEDPGRRALSCALAMRERSRPFCDYVSEHFGASLRIGVAISAGRAVVGRLGYFRERHLGAIGDVLNLAARLEDLNRDLDTEILITDSVARVGSDLAELGRSFALKVRGRSAPVTAHEVLGPARRL